MNIQDLLKYVFTQERKNPNNESELQYRAIFRKEEGKEIPLTGWFSDLELVKQKAVEHLENGMLKEEDLSLVEQGKNVVEDAVDAVSEGAENVANLVKTGLAGLGAFTGDLKDKLLNLFAFKDGKVALNGSLEDVTAGLLDLFDNFSEAKDEKIAETNKIALDNVLKAASRTNVDRDIDLGTVSTLLTNPLGKGLELLRGLFQANDEEGEDNRALYNWFTKDYYTGLTGQENATTTYRDTALLRSKINGLVEDEKSGVFANLGLPALGAGLAGVAGVAGGLKDKLADKLSGLFAFNDDKVAFNGSLEDATNGLLDLFDNFSEAKDEKIAETNKIALDNVLKAASRTNVDRIIDLDTVSTLLTNPLGKGLELLRGLFQANDEEGEDNRALYNWFTKDYYTGLTGQENATTTYRDTALLRSKINGLVEDEKSGVFKGLGLPALGAGLAGVAGLAGGLKDKLAGLFSFDDGNVNLSGKEEDVVDGLSSLFDNFKGLSEPDANLNRLALGNAVKAVQRTHKSGKFGLEELNDVLTNKDKKGEGILASLLGGLGDPNENKALKNWFDTDYYSGLRGDKDATDTYERTKPLRSKLADLLSGAKKGILPAALGLGALAGTVGKGMDALKDAGKDVGDKVAQGVDAIGDAGKNVLDKAGQGVGAVVGAGASALDNVAKGVGDVFDGGKEEKKKRKLWPFVAAGVGLASLPFWAIPYNLNYKLPDNATITNAPTSYRFYENVTLPTPQAEGLKFEGWYSDPEFTHPVDRFQFSLGGKDLYPKFAETKKEEPVAQATATPEANKDEANFKALKDAFPKLTTLFSDLEKGMENASDDMKAKFQSLSDRYKALQDLINKGGLTGDALTKAQKELDDLTKEMTALQKDVAAAGTDASTAGGTTTDGSTTGNSTTTGGSTGTGTGTTSGNEEKTPVIDTATK